VSRRGLRPGLRLGFLALLVLGVAPARGQVGEAGVPEVVRVRVPSGRVPGYFPEGTPLRGMPLEEFEGLLAEARAAADRSTPGMAPRLLRAVHRLALRGEVLVGRSELVVEGGDGGLIPLSPWNAWVEAEASSEPVLTTPDGRVAIRAEPGSARTIRLAWEIASREGGGGRAFEVALPELPLTAVELELPPGVTPEGLPAVARPPEPSGGEPARVRWRSDGRGGSFRLTLREDDAHADGSLTPQLWVEGPTRVEVGDEEAHWEADWRLVLGPRAPRTLTVEMDSGLELLGVTGPEVGGFHSERAEPGGPLTLRVQLSEGVGPSTRLLIEALARAPGTGRWVVPSARLVGGTWTGGRTSVWVGPSREVELVRPVAGRAAPPRAEELDLAPVGGRLLAFEGLEPRPVAELAFGEPRAEAVAEVQGLLRIGDEGARLTARVAWSIRRGPVLDLPIDLPAGWTPQAVIFDGKDEPASWRQEARDGGGTRVVVQPPSGLVETGGVAVRLDAVASGGRSSRVAAPRIRPVGARINDELWRVRGEPGTTIEAVEARGLSWADPSALDDLDPDPATDAQPQASLAWRWVEADGEAVFAAARTLHPPVGETFVVGQVGGDELVADWYVALEPRDARIEDVVVRFNEPLTEPPSASVLGGEIGPTLPVQPAPESAAPGGSAWRFELPRSVPADRRLVLRGRMERRGDHAGRLPLVSLAGPSQASGTALVWVDGDRRLDAEANGVQATDRALAEGAFRAAYREAVDAAPTDPAGRRLAAAFTFGAVPGDLALRTTALQRRDADGAIAEARLAVRPGPDGRAIGRLTLLALPGTGRRLEARLPPGASLQRALLDGKPVVPLGLDTGFAILLDGTKAGRTTREVVLEFESEPGPDGSQAIRWPGLSMPCLATVTEFELPAGILVDEAGPGLTRAGVAPSEAPARPRLLSPTPDGAGKRDTELAAVLGELGKTAAPRLASGSTLGDWLTGLDAGSRPVVVDRLALASVGLGPRSRPGALAGGESGEASLTRTLQALGLRIVPLGPTVLLTTAGGLAEIDRREDPGPWAARMREAVALGADRSDRFQAVARWRDEPTPEAAVDALGPRAGSGTSTSRWEGLGTPGGPIRYATVRSERGTGVALASSLAVLALGVLARSSPRSGRGLLAGGVLAAGLTAGAIGQQGLASGLVLGVGGMLAYWLGSGRAARAEARDEASGVGLSAAAGSVGFLLIGWLAVRTAAEPPRATDPILVLLPYEGAPDPARTPDRVVLRLADFERLGVLANREEAVVPPPIVASQASHEVRELPGGREALVISDYQLDVPGGAEGSWNFPLGEGRETRCEIDGRDVPVRVSGDGAGRVSVPAGGAHRARLRRRVPIGAGGTLRLPVVPVATAEAWAVRARVGAVPVVRSAVGSQSDQRGLVRARLGPSPALEVAWSPVAADEGAFRSVEGLLLWDLEPAGDRVQARLTLRGDGSAARLRLALDPGWMVRSATFPGWADASSEGTPEHPVWAARLDPPLADGQVVGLELWRPASPGLGGSEASRTAPRLVPLDAEAWSGVVAARVAPLWDASFEPGAIGHAGPAEAFRTSWGPLPAPAWNVAAAFPWAEADRILARVKPAERPPAIRPSVRLDLGAGRMDIRVEARCTAPGRLTAPIEFGIPESLEVVSVEAVGLLGWDRPEPGRLVVRLDESADAARDVVLTGWIGLAGDPLGADSAARERALPRFSWPGATVEPGSLVVRAPAGLPFRVEERVGMTPVLGPLPDESGMVQAGYRLDAADYGGVVRWLGEPPRASVAVWSHLTVDPRSVEWTARVRCRVAGGPFRVLRLEVPAEWSGRLRVESDEGGVASEVVREGPKSILEVRPDRPIWGTRDVLIRGTRPIEGRSVVFPNLVPLGNGRVTSYMLAWSDRSGRSPVAEGSAGIQPVDPARFDEPGLPVPRHLERKVYQVLLGSWTLRLRLAAEPGSEPGDDRSRAVAWADTECSVSDSGEVAGLSKFRLAAGRAPFLLLEVPDGVSPHAAIVGGQGVRPLEGADGRLVVPLGDASEATVTLVWSARAAGDSLAVPTPTSLAGEAFVTVYAPRGMTPVGLGDRVASTSLEALEVERLERLGASLEEGGMRLDRSSTRDRAALVAGLVGFEVRRRAVARMLEATLPGRPDIGSGVRQSLRDRLGGAAESLDSTLRDAGLDDLRELARRQAGASVGDEEGGSGLDLVSEATPEVRLRRLGWPSAFRGTAGPDEGPIRLGLERRSSPDVPEEGGPWPWLASAALALGLGVGLGLPRQPPRPVVLSGLVAAPFALLCVAVGVGLPALGTAAVLFALGRAHARSA
jgi:hypothetical protein